MDRNTIQKILIGLFLLACIFIGLKTFNLIGTIKATKIQKLLMQMLVVQE
jgi:hypothetical protein